VSDAVAPALGGQPVLTLSGVRKRFPDGTVALDGIDLAVGRGELVSVVGPSGCGKSTLLRLASGLTEPSGGTVAAGTGRIGYVFQDATLLPWRTVRANVELVGELRRLPKPERGRRADEAIKLVGLEGFTGHRPHQLSGGMRMRVSLARSLTLAPELFLFDEPFGAIDEINRQRLGDELMELFLAQRFAGVFVTHSVTEALFLSSRVLVMSDRPGRLIADFPVPFEYPRAAAVRYSKDFARLAGEVSGRLSGGV
jgi:NitT/TauT family transport system ATP-binding protein